jgi:glutamate carboxypeptidase
MGLRTFAVAQAAASSSVVAGRMVVTGDLRTFTSEQLQRTRQRMRDVVAQSLPHTSATITFEEGYPPMAASDGNRRLLQRLDQASRDLGFGAVTAVDPQEAGAADVSFVGSKAPMAIDGVGLMGSGGHTVHETADLSTLPLQAKRLAVMLARVVAPREQPHD